MIIATSPITAAVFVGGGGGGGVPQRFSAAGS